MSRHAHSSQALFPSCVPAWPRWRWRTCNARCQSMGRKWVVTGRIGSPRTLPNPDFTPPSRVHGGIISKHRLHRAEAAAAGGDGRTYLAFHGQKVQWIVASGGGVSGRVESRSSNCAPRGIQARACGARWRLVVTLGFLNSRLSWRNCGWR